ncbi:hypothetical protein FHS01_003366 [Longimicrobium terrae]|nr:hypothetical protein [Longimicrobium terrae]MBB4637330.1 hypothetical protein [Longimicrobium terrae]
MRSVQALLLALLLSAALPAAAQRAPAARTAPPSSPSRAGSRLSSAPDPRLGLRGAPGAVPGLPARPAAARKEDEEFQIEVSGLWVEEAYNQEAGVLQQTVRGAAGEDGWTVEVEQEWPILSERHQLSLEVEAGGDGVEAVGAGYRLLVLGGDDEPLTLSPGIAVEYPMDSGDVEFQALLPLAVQVAENWTANALGAVNLTVEEEEKREWFAGGSLFWRARPYANLIVEAVYTRGDSPFPGDGQVESAYVLPGVQVAVPVGGLHLVPGVGVPVGFGPSRGRAGVMLYLSTEVGFGR